jgi:hypothetical protein
MNENLGAERFLTFSTQTIRTASQFFRIACFLSVVMLQFCCSTALTGEMTTTVVFPADISRVEVPVHRAFMSLLAEVRINDQEAGLFLIHTGAKNSVIDPALATKFQLPVIQKVMLSTPEGRSAANYYRLKNLGLGSVQISLNLVGMDLSRHRQSMGTDRLQGILALDVLEQFPFLYDHRHRRLTAYEPKSFVPPQSSSAGMIIDKRGIVIPVHLPTGLLTDCRFMTDFPGFLSFDGSLTQFWPEVMKLRLDPPHPNDNPATPVFVQFNKIQVGSHEDTCMIAQILPSSARSSVRPEGMIGASFMRRSLITIDMAKHQKIWMSPIKAAEVDDRCNEPDLVGCTDVLIAAAAGEIDHLKALIARKVKLDVVRGDGFSPLHLAVSSGQGEAVAVLLGAGVPLDIRSKTGQTPLGLALANNTMAIAAQLRLAGAKDEGLGKPEVQTAQTWKPGTGPSPNQAKVVQVLTPPAELIKMPWRGVSAIDACNAWVVGGCSTVISTSDGGESWQKIDIQAKAELRAVRFLKDGKGAVIGDSDPDAPKSERAGSHDGPGRPLYRGSLLRSGNGGLNWQASGLNTNFFITCIDMISGFGMIGTSCGENHLDGDIYIFSDNMPLGKVKTYRAINGIATLNNDTWIAVGSPVSVGFSPKPVNPLYLAGKTRILTTKDQGKTWTPANGSDGQKQLRAVCKVGSTSAIAVGDAGTMLLSSDGGIVWKGLASEVKEDLFGVACQGEKILAIGNKGLLLSSTDQGKTWTKIASPAPVPLRSVTVLGTFFLVVGDQGTIWRVKI